MSKNIGLLSPHIEAFMAVAKHKSVHAAARAIHISQTAMTQRIRVIEHKLKITLFIRTPQGMYLTSEGEQLLRYCHVVADYSNETLSNMTNAGVAQLQRVTIAGPSSIMNSRILPQCLPLMRKFPMLYITFDIKDTDDIVTQLRCGHSQFALLEPHQVSSDMQVKKINAEEYLLVGARHLRNKKLLDIIKTERIIDFDEKDKTTLDYLEHFELLKFARPDRLFVNRNESLCQMLVEGYGYGTLTSEFAAPYLKQGDLIKLNSGKTFNHRLVLAWFPRPKPPQYFLAILDAIE